MRRGHLGNREGTQISTRAEYIRRALEQMNRETRARLRARRLRDASHKVRGENLRVNAEFAAIERDVDA